LFSNTQHSNYKDTQIAQLQREISSLKVSYEQSREVEESLRTYILKIENNHNQIINELKQEQANKIEILNDYKIKNDEISKLKTELI